MSSAPGMCQAYPVYTSDAPEDVSTALHGSGEGSLCTQVHASCGSTLYSVGHPGRRTVLLNIIASQRHSIDRHP